jgi:hypothetical protein
MSDAPLGSPSLVTHHSLLECKGCLFFNNLEEVNHTMEVSRGVVGFRLYVSPIAVEEFEGNGSNTSA